MRRPQFRGATGPQATLRKLRAILNKLTEDNVTKLGSQIVADFTFE
jgi:hypothetical protein